ncbi:MAG: leucine-rich repeat protein [Clostridiales bacterium]|nr:leucine-rich repeat protein [Clostridiales bacterium]
MKRFWAGLLCLMLLCGAVCAETLNGRNASGNVSIPYGVLNIESEAFAGCADIISLRIPETVKSLGDGAFRDCPALTTAVIEEGLTTIGAYAFAGNGALRSVTLPDSVLSIEDTAFEDCASLTLTVAEGSYAEQYAKKLGIPYTHEQSSDAKVWINRRYMNNLGLVDPVTLDELSEVVQLMMTCDADGNGIADELVAAAATEDDLRLIPQAVGASQEQASLFLASGKLGTCKVGAFSFDVLPLFVVKLEIPAEYQVDYEAFEPKLPSVIPTPKPAVTPTPAPTFNPNAKVWINRRYMNNLGLVDPVTPDELSEVVQLMMTCDADGNGIADELVAAAATEDDLRLIPQAVGASQEQASLFLASGKLGTYKVGAFSFDVLPLFVVKLEIPAEYQADYEAFEPTLPSVTPTQKPAVTPTPAPTFNPNAKVWINRRYMDNLGLVDPVTPDELSEVVQHMKTNDPDGNGIIDTLIAAAATEDDLRLIPQAVGASQEQASLFLASGNLGTYKVGAFSFDILPLFVVKLEIPAEYQADYEAFEPTLPSVTPTPRPTANPNAKVWINRTFMDNMGLVDPATLDELESVIEIMKSGDPDGNGIDDTIIAAAGNADELCLIPQAVGTTKEQAALFIAAGNLGTTVIGEIDFEKQPLFVVADVIPAEYQADYEAFEPKLPSVTPTPRPTANPNAKVWINRTFMDNMGLVDPATLDELESVIEAMKTGDPDGNGVDDTIIGAAGNADELCLIPQAVGTTKEQAALFIAAGNLRTTVTGEIDFEKQPLFVVTDTIPAAYQAIYERF